MSQTPQATPSSSQGPSGHDVGLALIGLEVGARIGRYVVLSELGTGAMGLVLAVYDPELDRKAALKLLSCSPDRPKARTRLRREALALAKLNHPNVVTVYDVGIHDGQVFVAMELVSGRTIAQWMRTPDDRPRPWREVVDVFTAAGRGLAAVHAANLVHRDFKPDNVLIGDDGRVRVADFGLARLTDEPELDDEPDVRVDPLHVRLTRTGTSLGTPAYMAPERFRGHAATCESDQFAFCVALFEALYGLLPYTGKSVEELTIAVVADRIQQPRRAQVPAWLARVVRRGLARDPSERFPDMPQLLAALRGGARRRRALLSLAGVGVVGMVVLGSFVQREREQQLQEVECRAVGDRIDQIWNEETRAALRDGLLATEVGYAPTVADKLMPWLDRKAQTWREQATLACQRAEIEARYDTLTYDKVSWCLEHNKIEFEVLLDALTVANAKAVESAVLAAAALPMAELCTNEASLATLPEPPDARDPLDLLDRRGEFMDVHRELVRATMLGRTGEYEQALALVRAALSRAEALGFTPLTAAVRGRESALLSDSGAFDEAEVVGATAYMEAARSGNWDSAARIASRQAAIVGWQLRRTDEGKVWVTRDAAIAIAHAGDPFGLREAVRLSSLALLHMTAGEYEIGKRLQEQVLQRQLAVYGPQHPDVAATLINLGVLHRKTADYHGAKALYERALEICEQTLGPEHPQLALSLNNLGIIELHFGHYEAAQRYFERALEIQRATLGAEHPACANTLSNLADVHEARGDHARTERLVQEVLAIRERLLGPEHPDLAISHMQLANLMVETGRLEQAEPLLEQAHASLERSLGATDELLSYTLFGFARLAVVRGELEAARAMYERSLAIRERALEPDHTDVAEVLRALGGVHEQLGEEQRARELYECALDIMMQTVVPARELADVRFGLARVLVDEQPERAHTLVEQARAGYVADGFADEQLADVHAWLLEFPNSSTNRH